jgi:hypothetical protein
MPAQLSHLCTQMCILNHIVTPTTVAFITNYRVSKPSKMNADLVCPSSFYLDIDKCKPLVTVPHFVERHCISSSANDSHSSSITLVTRERLVD